MSLCNRHTLRPIVGDISTRQENHHRRGWGGDYLSQGTQVEVLDLKSHEKIGVINPTPGIHRIAVVPGANVGYIPNGRPNMATMFDIRPLKPLKKYRLVKSLMRSSTTKATVLPCWRLRPGLLWVRSSWGAPEAAVSDDHGLIFVNLDDTNEIAVFDAKSLMVKHHWKSGTGEEPTGLAFDKPHHRLFSTCNKVLIVMDSQRGKVLAEVPTGSGTDGAVFDTTTGSALSPSLRRHLNGSERSKSRPVRSRSDCNDSAWCPYHYHRPQSHHIFVTTAEYGPARAATTENPKPRPAVKPGSFVVLEYAAR